MTTYTVHRLDDSSHIEGRGLSLSEAAEALLGVDGYAHEIRVDADGYHRLYISDGSANSTRGARRVNACPDYNGRSQDEVYAKVMNTPWRGYIAVTDEQYDRDEAAARAEAEAEADE